MAERDFFDERSRARVAAAIREVESRTAAEVVVQVRHVAGRHRDADYLWGAIVALAVLLVLLFAPAPFRLIGFPVQTALGFLAGAFASSRLPPLRRLLVSRRAARIEAHRAALAAFHDLGVSRTRGRWGLLVMVATFERSAQVVTDVGIDVETLGAPWRTAIAAIDDAARRADFDAFIEALGRLGPILAAQHPHTADDVDELPDEVAPEGAGDLAEADGGHP